MRILADGSSAPEENRELFVFEKHRGEWKIALYMFNKTSWPLANDQVLLTPKTRKNHYANQLRRPCHDQ